MNCYLHNHIDAVGVCVNCGKGVCGECATPVEGRLFCKDCNASGAPQNQPRKTNLLSIISMVLGIVSMPLFIMCGEGLPLGIAAIITGFIARKQIQDSQGKQEGNGMALVGIITGAVSIALVILYILIIIFVAMMEGLSNF